MPKQPSKTGKSTTASRGKTRKVIPLHVYGILDSKKNVITKVSLDETEIQMEIALMGGLPKDFVECEFNIKLRI